MRSALGIAIVACALVLPATAHSQVAGSPPADIRAVDFQNFTYSSLSGTRVRVRDGRWSPRVQDESYRRGLSVVEVLYGDLTGDGRDEAIVLLDELGGGNGHFTFANVYASSEGIPRRLGRVTEGDRASGGISAIRVENRRLEVDRFGTEHGAMDVEWIETELWSVRRGSLHRDATTDRRRYLDRSWGTTSPRIRFLPRTTRAALAGYVSPAHEERWTLRARPGRALVLDLTRAREHTRGLRVEVLGADGMSLGVVADGERARIALQDHRDCTLRVTTNSAASYRIDVTVTADAPVVVGTTLAQIPARAMTANASRAQCAIPARRTPPSQ